MRGLVVVGLILVVLAIAAGCNYVVGSMVDQRTAVQTMENAGFTNVRVIARHNIFVPLLGCSSEDTTKFDMDAVNSSGKRVVGVYVCVGWPFKGATIRYR